MLSPVPNGMPAPTTTGADDTSDADAFGTDAAPDLLLACLAFLTRYYGRPQSPSVLLSGLPLSSGQISIEMFRRAAARAGLKATVVKRRLNRIHPWSLPAVILLEDGGAAVLVERRDQDKFVLVLPLSLIHI